MRSLRFLVSRRWALFGVVVLLLAWLAWWLGEWQFDRLEDRREANAVVERNERTSVTPVAEVLAPGRPVSAEDEWRRVRAVGRYAEDETVVVRYQTREGASGVDVVVQPHTVVARQTTRVTRGYTDEAAVLEQDSAEVLEITVESGSALAGDSLSDVALDLPDGFVIGAVVRNGTLRTPRGGTVIQTGDHVVAFVDTDDLDEVAAAL